MHDKLRVVLVGGIPVVVVAVEVLVDEEVVVVEVEIDKVEVVVDEEINGPLVEDAAADVADCDTS